MDSGLIGYQHAAAPPATHSMAMFVSTAISRHSIKSTHPQAAATPLQQPVSSPTISTGFLPRLSLRIPAECHPHGAHPSPEAAPVLHLRCSATHCLNSGPASPASNRSSAADTLALAQTEPRGPCSAARTPAYCGIPGHVYVRACTHAHTRDAHTPTHTSPVHWQHLARAPRRQPPQHC